MSESAIQGWYMASEVVGYLCTVMFAAGMRGAYVEVGVHHGKSFIATLQHSRPGFLEPSVALDVFGDQTKNQDHSGKGSRAIFERHLLAHASPAQRQRVRVHEGSSLELTAGDVRNYTGGVAPVLFSVDACHNYDCTLNDLHLAFDALHPRGLILLDDYWNKGWPGVASGMHRFLAEQRKAVVLGYGQNKVFLAPWGAAAFYWDALWHMCGTVCDRATDPGSCVQTEKAGRGCILHQHCAPWHPVTKGGLISIGMRFSPPMRLSGSVGVSEAAGSGAGRARGKSWGRGTDGGNAKGSAKGNGGRSAKGNGGRSAKGKGASKPPSSIFG